MMLFRRQLYTSKPIILHCEFTMDWPHLSISVAMGATNVAEMTAAERSPANKASKELLHLLERYCSMFNRSGRALLSACLVLPIAKGRQSWFVVRSGPAQWSQNPRLAKVEPV